MGKYLNKPTGDVPPSSSCPLSLSGEWPTVYPALVEFLTLGAWEDGSLRLCGSLTLFVDQSLWKLCLNDKDNGRVAFCSGCSVEDVLRTAEEGIVHSVLNWRPAAPKNGRGKQKLS